MSFRYGSGINKPGFNALAAQTTTYTYELWSWGRGQYGIVGDGTTVTKLSPVQLGALTTWLKISGGNYHSLVTKTDGTLWTWGYNAQGQLGTSNLSYYSSPKQVGALTTWATVCGGGRSSYAIKTDGTLWSWGYNAAGQLGLGNTTDYNSPKQVGALTTWLSVSGSYGHTVATTTTGTLYAWGDNTHGQLGLGNTTSYSSPKQVGALTTWARLNTASNAASTLAIKTDGTLWVWGRNINGLLGLGNTTSYSSPKQVGALTTWLKVAGAYWIIAVKTDGTLWSWGRNNNGQLGLGNTTNYSSPKQIGALTTWITPTAYGYSTNSMAIKTDGTLWTWGYSDYGIGLGNMTSYSSPKQIGALTTWYDAVSLGFSSQALKY
jgi:alpha-tubulin suppressor-like RCC1 family protein